MAATAKKKEKLSVQARLLQMLSDVDRPADFCTSADRTMMMPGLEVDGIGTINLPLAKTQARKMIKLCHQAPYGKGTETIVDLDVRRVWELDPKQFRLTNTKWNLLIDSIVMDVKKNLGLENQKLSAHLYKLLVYEEGGFFLPHRDGEKLDGMVATLVIGLPSVHTGGELVVSHDNQQQTIAMAGAASGLELSYAAFYADCKHEVRPVKEGFRLCLTYNVTLEKSRGKKVVNAPSYGQETLKVAQLLGEWSKEAEAMKLAVTLDHRYTQDGLKIAKLKGIDRARADLLFAAAEQADCVAHLALVTLWQSGSAAADDDDYSYGRRGRYRNSYHDDDEDDDYEDSDISASGHSMDEVFDQSLTANHWSNFNGKQIKLGEINFEVEDVVSDCPPEDWDPSQEEFEGYTGNAGMTLERWYHRAAIVIWPHVKHFEILSKAGTDSAIGGLQVMVKELKRAAKAHRETLRKECCDFADTIIDTWQVGNRVVWPVARDGSDTNVRELFPKQLFELGDADRVLRFMAEVLTRDGDIQVDKSFVKFIDQKGWKAFASTVGKILQAVNSGTIARNVQLVQTLCIQRDRNADRIQVCTELCEQSVAALITFDQSEDLEDWRHKEPHRAVILPSLIKSMLAVGAEGPLQRLVDYTLSAADKYDLTDVHLAAIFDLESKLAKLSDSNSAISSWLVNCSNQLVVRTRETPQPPADFRRDHSISCKCKDCRTLISFLANPSEKQIRLPMAENRRRHLHDIINGNCCDLTHVTERRGSPYTLVCTKTTASYKTACQIHDRDQKNLARIRTLIEKMK